VCVLPLFVKSKFYHKKLCLYLSVQVQLPTHFIQCSVLHIYIIKHTYLELLKMNISMSQDLLLLTTQYIHTANWIWNENYLLLCIMRISIWSKQSHEQLQYFNYNRNFKIFYTWDLTSVGRISQKFGFHTTNYIWYLSDITNYDIWNDILNVKFQGYGIKTCSIQISIQIWISCPYLDIMLDG